MNAIKTALVALGLVAGYGLGAITEANTHALQVARVTGAPYLQVLGPDRLFLQHQAAVIQMNDEPEEVCGPNVECEANQD